MFEFVMIYVFFLKKKDDYFFFDKKKDDYCF